VESRPDAPQVAGRLLALRCVVTHAVGTPLLSDLEARTEAERFEISSAYESRSKSFWDSVNSSAILPHLSPWERQFATTTILTMSLEQHLAGMWRMEAGQVLMWALRLIPDLTAPDKQTDLDLRKIEILSRPASFLNSAALRTPEKARTADRHLDRLISMVTTYRCYSNLCVSHFPEMHSRRCGTM
jgi:hypothetical protein